MVRFFRGVGGRPHGTGTLPVRHNHVLRPSSTAIAGSARGAEPGAGIAPKYGGDVAQAGIQAVLSHATERTAVLSDSLMRKTFSSNAKEAR